MLRARPRLARPRLLVERPARAGERRLLTRVPARGVRRVPGRAVRRPRPVRLVVRPRDPVPPSTRARGERPVRDRVVGRAPARAPSGRRADPVAGRAPVRPSGRDGARAGKRVGTGRRDRGAVVSAARVAFARAAGRVSGGIVAPRAFAAARRARRAVPGRVVERAVRVPGLEVPDRPAPRPRPAAAVAVRPKRPADPRPSFGNRVVRDRDPKGEGVAVRRFPLPVRARRDWLPVNGQDSEPPPVRVERAAVEVRARRVRPVRLRRAGRATRATPAPPATVATPAAASATQPPAANTPAPTSTARMDTAPNRTPRPVVCGSVRSGFGLDGALSGAGVSGSVSVTVPS